MLNQQTYNQLFQLNLDEIDFLKDDINEEYKNKEIVFSALEDSNDFTVTKNSNGEWISSY